MSNVKMVQSPIAISLRDSTIEDKIKSLKFVGHWERDGKAFIENTGISAQITFQGRKVQPYVSDGPLKSNERYIFEQMHFHWAENDSAGSEHIINGQVYSMEAHLVHFNAKYRDFETAVTKKDGLVVIAFFIQAFGDTKCHTFSKISDYIPNIRNLNSKCALDSDCLLWMTSQDLSKHYYVYGGSLTTPPYNECVTWIIYQTPVFVSKQQIAVFRNLVSINQNEKIVRNCRSIQKMLPNQTPSIIFTRNTRLKSKL